jgi:maltokinase
VAGMLRSIDYSAQVAHRAGALAEPNAWAHEARDAFLEAYAAGSTLDLDLLGAFEIEKACYEVRYEANNRPDWAWLPIGALERLAIGD